MTRPAASTEMIVPGRPREHYRPQLDGVRALAIALVLVHHFIYPIEFAGLIGVDVFFVLSGFLITGILLREIDKHGRIRLKRFYARRLIRLYPPLLLAALVMTIAALFIADSVPALLADTGWAVSYLMPFAITLDATDGGIWRHTWSLGMEEIFYVIWPAVLILCMRLRRGKLAALVVSTGLGLAFTLALVIASTGFDKSPYILRFGGLFIGCAAAIFMSQRVKVFGPTWGLVGLGLIVAAVLSPIWLHGEVLSIILAIAGTVLLVLHLTTGQSALIRVFAAPAPAYIGRISYELYIWHFAVIGVLVMALGGNALSVAGVAVPLSIALAVAGHALLVRRMDAWKARLPY